MNRLTLTGAALLVATGAGIAAADSVFTSDGSKIVGRIERMGGGKLVITSDILGRVELDATRVTAVHIDEPLTVEFESGDRLVGTLNVSDDQSQSVMRTGLGDVAVTPANIKAIWPVGGEAPDALAAREAAEQTAKKYIPDWTTALEVGATRKEGNTDTRELRGRLDVNRKTSEDLLHFYLSANYGEQNDRRTTNEYRGGINYRKDITAKWFWYTRTELEFDEFENLDLRATVAAGVGYFWIREPAHELSNTVGAGYRHESYDNGRTEDEAILDLGLNYRLDIAPWLQFTHATVYSPGLEDFDSYRVDFDTAFLIPFQDKRFKFKFGMRNEYNSRPQRGLERLDNTYYANLVIALPN